MPEQPLEPPAPLEKTHITNDFTSGADELDEWLKDYAWVNHRSGNARVFVATRDTRVVGYYALGLPLAAWLGWLAPPAEQTVRIGVALVRGGLEFGPPERSRDLFGALPASRDALRRKKEHTPSSLST